ncbi:hypothetical protein GCM10027039_01970 [Terrabacter koreensis]
MYWRTVKAEMPRSATTFLSPIWRTLEHGAEVAATALGAAALVVAGAVGAADAGPTVTRTVAAAATRVVRARRRTWREDMGGASRVEPMTRPYE